MPQAAKSTGCLATDFLALEGVFLAEEEEEKEEGGEEEEKEEEA